MLLRSVEDSASLGLLLENGADKSVTTFEAETELDLSAESGHEDLPNALRLSVSLLSGESR
jgi:hypothetical protein